MSVQNAPERPWRVSEHLGLSSVPAALERGKVSKRLRNRVWTEIFAPFWDRILAAPGVNELRSHHHESFRGITYDLMHKHFGLPVDALKPRASEAYGQVRKMYLDMPEIQVIDVIQIVFDSRAFSAEWKERAERDINQVLQEERAWFRILDGKVIPVSDTTTLSAIQTASLGPFPEAARHIDEALRILSDTAISDFRNVAKEALSAAESAAKQAAQMPNADFSAALSELAKKYDLHPALKKGLESLYGFGSSTGVRHDIKPGEPPLPLAEALFLLTVASAFINYVAEMLTRPTA